MDALRKIVPKVGKTLLLGTYIVDSRFTKVNQSEPLMYFFEPRELIKSDTTNVWGPTTGCVKKMLKVVGFPMVKMLKYDNNRAIFKASKNKRLISLWVA